MKKYFLLAAAAATVLAVSCAKEKAQPTTDPTPTEIEDNTPQPIRFGTNIAEVKAPITKAAIDAWDGSQKLYIFGYPLDANGLSDIENPKIDQVAANSPSGTGATNDGVRDPIEVLDANNNNAHYYYSTGKVYNFFGYYVGDATTNGTTAAAGAAAANAGNTAVELPIVIDGSQDIMVATTDKFADYIAAGATVSLDKVYSDVSARNDVVPDLIFKHQLSQFEFQTIYGGATPGNYNTIAIKSLTLDSYNKGTLTVAAADPNDIGFAADMSIDRVPLTLKGFDYTATIADWNTNAFPGDGNTPSDYAVLGTEIMAIPEGDTNTPANYTLHLTLVQKDANNNLTEATVDLPIDFTKLENATAQYAEAGKKYVVKITIYSLEEINITVSLEAWEDGGETAIDPDQDPRPVPTITITDPDPTQTLNLHVGDTQQITATAAYGTNNTVIAAVKYGTTNQKVATVSAAGLITAVKAGDCKIYVYVEGQAATANDSGYQGAMKTFNVHVDPPLPASTLSGLAATKNIDNTAGGETWNIPGSNTLKVQVGGVDVASQPATFSYESSDPGKATVDADGLVTAVADGETTITISWAAGATYAAGHFDVTVTVANTPVAP